MVYLNDLPDGQACLKDISLSGGCITSNDFLDMVPKTRYVLCIVPEQEANIEKFELDVESRWIRTSKRFSESGFVVIVRPNNMKLEQYVDYLSRRDAQDDR
jgi:hypothetical protein